MQEIEAIPWNGYNVVSTFSGAGGSCLGYRMAGFRVLWASEFIPAAQEVYRLNHPDTILDTRDIRIVQPQEILDAIEMQKGEIDLLDGSPPCASFSTAGKREAGWGKVKKYSDTEQRVDDLFFEYARILEGLQPRVFVAENVSGLVKGKAKGYFKEILQALKDCGYNVKAKLLDAQWLGVPAMRQRLIFQGIRLDLERIPIYPVPLPYRYVLTDCRLSDLENGERNWLTPRMKLWYDNTRPGKTLDTGNRIVEKGTSGITKTRNAWIRPAATIMNHSNAGTCDAYHPDIPATFSIPELKRICSFPDNFQLTGNFKRQWERLGRAVPPVMMYHIAKTIRDEVLCKIN